MPQNTCKVRAVAINQRKPTNTKTEKKNTCKHVYYDAARYEATTRTTRSRMHIHEKVQLRGHHGEFETHGGKVRKMRNSTHTKQNTKHNCINALALGRRLNPGVRTGGKNKSKKTIRQAKKYKKPLLLGAAETEE